jgi:hypothetical protein
VGAIGARQKPTGTTLGGFAQLERPWVTTSDLRPSFVIFSGYPLGSHARPDTLASRPYTTLVSYYVLGTAPSTRDRLGRKTGGEELYRVCPGRQSCSESTRPIGVWAPWTWDAQGTCGGWSFMFPYQCATGTCHQCN